MYCPKQPVNRASCVPGPVLRVTALAVLALACALWAPAAQAANLYPWPSDRYTRPDPTTATGLRLNMQLAEMPRNAVGRPIDPTEFNRNDGFSPGSLIATPVPGLDTPAGLHRTRPAPDPDLPRPVH